jgi:hypothetical protein
MMIARISQQTDISKDDGIDTNCHGIINCLMPDFFRPGLRIGIAGKIDMNSVLVRVFDGIAQFST